MILPAVGPASSGPNSTQSFANEDGAKTISLVGFDGGVLHRESICSILVPVDSTPQTEAIHLVIEHLLMQLIQEELATSR
jgi:D-sedoheptulose 7-phosphate isomerase